MKHTFLNPEDAYRQIEEALNFLEERGEEPLRGLAESPDEGRGLRGKSGRVLLTSDGSWAYFPGAF